jgi:hypothetical protein
VGELHNALKRICGSSQRFDQGDQIGRIFDHWVIVYFCQLHELAHIFGLLCSTVIFMHQLRQKMDWATFWANFSQTDLVTLASIRLVHTNSFPQLICCTSVDARTASCFSWACKLLFRSGSKGERGQGLPDFSCHNIPKCGKIKHQLSQNYWMAIKKNKWP